jgi:ABC-type branched-subunit amino acid transport system ATPase component
MRASRLAGVPARCRTHAKRARQDIALLIEEKKSVFMRLTTAENLRNGRRVAGAGHLLSVLNIRLLVLHYRIASG